MAAAFAILVLMLAAPAVYATDYTVGDTSGWETGVDYNTWASGKKFVTGDTLCKLTLRIIGENYAIRRCRSPDIVSWLEGLWILPSGMHESITKTIYQRIDNPEPFSEMGAGSHAVDEVNEDDYKNCNSGNALASHTDGSTKITLSKSGSYYYICPTLGHCTGGMKLAVTVSDASTPTTTPSTTPASPTSPSAGSTPTPTPANRTTTTPTQSSSPSGAVGTFKNLSVLMVLASLVLAPLLSGLMG
ncbi:hypothetical protein ACLOJK_030500 [Asimina triloba]